MESEISFHRRELWFKNKMQGLALHEVDPPWYQPRACALASISFAGSIACFTAAFFVYWSSWPIILFTVFVSLTACILCVMCARGFQRHRRLRLPSLGSADRVSKPGAKRVVVDSVTAVAERVETAPTGLAQKEPNRNANAKPVLAKLKEPVGEKWIPNPFAFLQGTVRATNDAVVSVRDDVEVASTTDLKESPATQHDQTAGGSEMWSPLAMLQRAISTIDGKTAAARADGHIEPTSLAEVAAAAAPKPAVTKRSSSAAMLPNTRQAGEVGPQSTMMKPVPRKARGSSTKLGEKLGYEPPTDAELQQTLLMNIGELTLSVATLFILTTYASLQYQGNSIFIIFQAHTYGRTSAALCCDVHAAAFICVSATPVDDMRVWMLLLMEWSRTLARQTLTVTDTPHTFLAFFPAVISERSFPSSRCYSLCTC